MVRRGFTIVELLVIIIVMGILLVLGVANLRGSQAQARDKQREVNVQTLASNIEDFYTTGKPNVAAEGRYPSSGLIGQETNNLPNLNPKILIDPSAPSGTTSSLVLATTPNQGAATITPTPSSSTPVYVYQPLRINASTNLWELCTGSPYTCRKFNLYYYQETNSTNPVVMITSRNQ